MRFGLNSIVLIARRRTVRMAGRSRPTRPSAWTGAHGLGGDSVTETSSAVPGQDWTDVQGLETGLSAAGASASGAPNVVVILLDDVGFGQPSTFGGPIPTPQLDKLASQGLKYTRFHTTGICSPTRVALLTGRNHHQWPSARSPSCLPVFRGIAASGLARRQVWRAC